MKYTVGQILYVILEKQQIVYPMQVIEEITKKILHSSTSEVFVEVDYLLLMGGKNPKPLHLSAVQGEIFDSADSARNILIERATQSINKHIESAISKAHEWYGSNLKTTEPEPELPEDEIAYVDLGNGVKARVKI